MEITIKTGDLKRQAIVNLGKEWTYESLSDRARFRHKNGTIMELALTTIDWPPSQVREQFTKDYQNIQIHDSHVGKKANGIHVYYLVYLPAGVSASLTAEEIIAAQQAIQFSE